MIRDNVILESIRNSWHGVYALRSRVQRGLLGSFHAGSGASVIIVADIAWNLPFLHACATLNDALEQLAKERNPKEKGRYLGDLLTKTKDALPWKNYSVIFEAADRRNGLAHRGTIVPRNDCRRFIDAIEEELKGGARSVVMKHAFGAIVSIRGKTFRAENPRDKDRKFVLLPD